MSKLHYSCVVEGFNETESDKVRGTCPLEHVSVTGFIRDAVAEYTLVQTYENLLKDAPVEAVYSFPLYEGAAVVGFEAEVDGRKIVGQLREKGAARKEYDEAKKAGKVASLLEEETPDLFQACVGNIPPAKTVSIRVTLICDLKQDAEENQVRFVVPFSIAPRYGIPEGWPFDSNVDTSASKLEVSMGCAMSTAITSIQSPTHTIAVHLGTSSTDQTSFEPTRARLSLTADALLDWDLVIIVQTLGLDEPRALVEHNPRDGTHVMSLSFAPRFALNPLRSLELIFIIDRSGSMEGTRIKQAGAALELFLRSIPCEDHYFNVIGFGSGHQALFPKSVAYNEDSLKRASRYAQTLDADMGGTEITSAVQEAFQRRRQDVPSQLFLLTDGEVWDVDSLVATIREAVTDGEKKNAFVRVFSLGIGDAVSHDLIESVARAGGGYAQLVVENERMEKKVLNMLKSALLPPVTNAMVQWSDGARSSEEFSSHEEDFVLVEAEDAQPVVDDASTTEKAPINLFSTSPEVPSPPPPPSPPLSSPPDIITPILQAPFKLPILCSGVRFTVYAILAPTIPVPTELVLRGSSPDGPVELKVKTQLVHDVVETMPMLHSLAVRAMIRDLEEGSSYIHALGMSRTASQQQTLERLGVHMVKEGKRYGGGVALSSKQVTELTQKQILDVSIRYNLSSKHASWVAIDQTSQRSVVYGEVPPNPDAYDSYLMPSVQYDGCRLMGKAMEVEYTVPLPDEDSYEGASCTTDEAEDAGCLPVPQFSEFLPASSDLPGTAPQASSDETVADSDPHVRLQSILQHQSFDGSFPLVPEIAAFFCSTVKDLKARLEEVRKHSMLTLSGSEWATVWATCSAVEFMRKQLPDLQDEWELVVSKAEKRVEVLTSAHDVAAIKQAAALVAAGIGEPCAEDVPPIKEAVESGGVGGE